jgi:hypothetical protein
MWGEFTPRSSDCRGHRQVSPGQAGSRNRLSRNGLSRGGDLPKLSKGGHSLPELVIDKWELRSSAAGCFFLQEKLKISVKVSIREINS